MDGGKMERRDGRSRLLVDVDGLGWAVLVGVLAAFLSLAAPLTALAAGRVALVVGNSDYEHIGRLPNPANDAADMGAALQRLGFEVTITRNAGRTALTDALRAFTRRSGGADVALVFYAGHGMEMDGVNYLLPVDARLERDTDVRYETVTLDDVLASTSGAGLRLVILDACRNNPLARSMQRTVRTRNVSNGSLGDLNEDLLGDETLVAYSAAAGTTADDGEGRNSPYASALLAHLEDPVDIGVMFRRVRARVLSATNERQRPHEYSSLLREHYMGVSGGGAPASVAAGGPAGPAGVVTSAGGSSAVLAQQETVFWQSIVNSTSQADFEAYLARWPAGVYAPLARGRVTALRPAAADPPRPDPARSDPPAPASARLETLRDRLGPLDVFRDCRSCPELVVIPEGEFMMGAQIVVESQDTEYPIHGVRVGRFALGRYEVTRREYAAFVEATGHPSHGCRVFDPGRGWASHDDASWQRPGFGQESRHPAVCVSWEDAQTYVRWLSQETGESYRLPSEAEWEYAARGGTMTRRYWGDASSSQCEYANGADQAAAKRIDSDLSVVACDDGAAHTAPVGSYSANAFGLLDMLGNVWEWVEDCWHGDYKGAPRDGTAWTRGGDCGRRVVRGGSWYNDEVSLRTRARGRYRVGDRSYIAGFRVARMLD